MATIISRKREGTRWMSCKSLHIYFTRHLHFKWGYVCMLWFSRRKRHSIFYLYVSLWIALYISMYPSARHWKLFCFIFYKIQIFCSHRQIFSQIYQGKVTKTGSQQILITFLGINQSTASFRLSLNLIFY
jgi:hypothetical protein